MKPALAIFVKTPGLSPVKTRLAARIGTADAKRFHVLAAAATAAVAHRCEPALLPYWAVAEVDAKAIRAWPGFAHVSQGAGGLGARLAHVYAELQGRHGCVLMIGADTPQVTPRLIASALSLLDDERSPFVLGPAMDGGFWVFGGCRPVPHAVWLGVRYSQADTADQLRRSLTAFGAIANLPELGDVDDADDLPALVASIDALADPLPQQRELALWVRTVSNCLNEAPSSA